MTTEDKGSVSIWVGSLKAGDQAAARKNSGDRYFDKLVHVARAKPRARRRPGVVEDEEDAALSRLRQPSCGGRTRPVPPTSPIATTSGSSSS